MKKFVLLIVLLGGVASASAAMEVISPITAAKIYNGLYFPLERAFDNQPTWNSETSEPENASISGSDAPYYAGRWGYVDFGEGYADYTLYEGWTRYRSSSTGTGCGYEQMFWTDTDPGVTLVTGDDKPADAIDDFTADFNNNTLDTGGEQPWLQSFEYSGGYALQRRYLVMQFAVDTTGYVTNRASEYAFVGEVAPEPATMGLLALGGLALLRRRRSK